MFKFDGGEWLRFTKANDNELSMKGGISEETNKRSILNHSSQIKPRYLTSFLNSNFEYSK